MKENFKIEKELLFKNNIKEITSISLDRDYKVEDNKLIGNFIITGDYKIHEVSINKEKFNFKIPFKHNISNDVEQSTLKVEITDFLYDYNKDDLMVNIEYEVVGERKDILIFENEETLDDFLNKREVEVIDTRLNDIKEKVDNIDTIEITSLDTGIIENKDEDINKLKEEFLEENNVNIEKNLVREDMVDKKMSDNKNNILEDDRKIETEDIINKVSNIQDKFITYKIYKIEENDTLEGIVLKYNSSVEELKEYNELSNISVGDKIIIPIYE